MWAKRDPLARLRQGLAEERALDDELEARFLSEIDAEIDGGIARAEAEPKPDVATLFDDVYAVRPFHLEEQRRSLVERA